MGAAEVVSPDSSSCMNTSRRRPFALADSTRPALHVPDLTALAAGPEIRACIGGLEPQPRDGPKGLDGPRRAFARLAERGLDRPKLGAIGLERGDDFVVSMEVVKPGGTLLTVTERGFGKRTEIEEYRVQSRGGVGIINIATTTRNGLVVGVAYVQEGDELLVITQQGMILRMETDDVRSIGRATQGVTIIDLEDEDKVVSIARLVEKEDEESTTETTEDSTDS